MLTTILEQINVLHESNSKICRNLHDTKGMLHISLIIPFFLLIYVDFIFTIFIYIFILFFFAHNTVFLLNLLLFFLYLFNLCTFFKKKNPKTRTILWFCLKFLFKVDIEALKHAPNWGLRHRRDSISGLSTHSQPMGYAFGTHSPAPTFHSGKIKKNQFCLIQATNKTKLN